MVLADSVTVESQAQPAEVRVRISRVSRRETHGKHSRATDHSLRTQRPSPAFERRRLSQFYLLPLVPLPETRSRTPSAPERPRTRSGLLSLLLTRNRSTPEPLSPMSGGLDTSRSIERTASDPSNTSEVLYHVACHFLDQLESFLRHCVTTDEQLSHVSQLSPGSTVGKHIRHLVDHYRLLLDGLVQAGAAAGASSSDDLNVDDGRLIAEQAAPLAPLRVNYDIRLRNGDVESDHAACLDSLRQLKARLSRETGRGRAVDPERAVRLTATTPVEVQVSTTFARELWFASFHAGAFTRYPLCSPESQACCTD